MDALTLVIPTAAVANAGSNGPDSLVSGAHEEDAPTGFAALLASGLLQQDLATAAASPHAELKTAETAPDDEGAGVLAAENAAALAVAAAAIPAQANQAWLEHGEDLVAAAANAAIAAASADSEAQRAATFAADAATIAADGIEESLRAVPEQTLGAGDALEAQTAAPESATSLAQPLQLGAVEPAQPHQATAVLDVAAPVRSAEFAQSLSQQVVWMADKDAQVAELRINPPELGPVEVRLQLSGDEASVQFVSAHAEVRSAIEAALARLRESMTQAGIQLGEASVSAESFREPANHSESGEGGARYRSSTHDSEGRWSRTPIAEGVRRGLVDVFA